MTLSHVKTSPKLKASIIEPILLLGANGISIYELPVEMNRMSPPLSYDPKKVFVLSS